jgi:phosphatidylethanolamine/phosphatidyl-N-methylethanolamine N-methyltransferase
LVGVKDNLFEGLRVMKHLLQERFVYLRECLTHFTTTGSVLPSSQWAAHALTNPLRRTARPQRILEVGAGTGAVTTKILKDMIDGDEFTICELNRRFMRTLREKLALNQDFQRHKAHVTFVEGPVQELPEDEPYDVIICAIPFNNLSLAVVEEIFAKLGRLSGKDTHLSFFEYVGIREINKVVSLKERRQRFEAIDMFIKNLAHQCLVSEETVWLNFTPIKIYTFQLRRAA